MTFGGINSGLPPNLVDQLVDAERVPIQNMEVRKAKTQNKLKLVTELETKVRGIGDSIKELGGTRGFNAIKLITGDPNVIGGVVDPTGAAPGSWNIEVMELAQRAAAVSNGFPDKDRTELGVGYFQFETPEGTKEVYLSGGNSTLDAASKAINRANLGVRATVIQDPRTPDAPYKLMVSGMSVGGNNAVSYPTLYFLDGDQDFYFDETRNAKNGRIKVDGIEFEIQDNTVKDIVPGVTLELRQASPGRSINIGIKEDQEVVSGKVKTFVESANQVLGFIQSQSKLTAESDTTSTLGGDSLLRTVENDLRRLIQNPQYGVRSDITMMNQIGIAFNRNGTLEFDQEKFNAILARNPDAVREFLVGDTFSIGFIPSLRRTLSTLTDGAFGVLSQRKRGLEQKINQAEDRVANMERNVQRKEQTLRRQFANLEQTMSRMKSQGAYIAQRLGGDNSLGSMNFSGASTNG